MLRSIGKSIRFPHRRYLTADIISNTIDGDRGGYRRWSWGADQGVWGTEVPQWGPGAKPRQGVWGRSPQKLEHLKNTQPEF